MFVERSQRFNSEAAGVDVTQETTVQIKTFAASSTVKLDRKVNEFLVRNDIVVRQLHSSMSFGTYMVVVEYETR